MYLGITLLVYPLYSKSIWLEENKSNDVYFIVNFYLKIHGQSQREQFHQSNLISFIKSLSTDAPVIFSLDQSTDAFHSPGQSAIPITPSKKLPIPRGV